MPYIHVKHISCKFCGIKNFLFLQVIVKGKLYLTRRCRECARAYHRNYIRKKGD